MNLHKLIHIPSWIAGMQWFFFIFANIIVIPITIGAAFSLSTEDVTLIMRYSFIITGLACLLQALLGHKRPIMEGQSGLWWGIYLMLVTTATAQGMSLTTLGGSLALGVILSGTVTILLGVVGLGPFLAKLFNEGVMAVFILLLGFTLTSIFVKGMLGIPFREAGDRAVIDLPVASLAIFIALIVIVISIKSPAKIKSYAILIGIIIGWIMHALIFGTHETEVSSGGAFKLFPLGTPAWDSGIVLTCVLAGLLNLSNTFGALKGTESIFGEKVTRKKYAASLVITGTTNVASGVFGLVPYAPYVSSIGYLRQTAIYDRLPFLIGSFLFFMMGIIPKVGAFFTLLPLSIGSAVLFVAYLQLLLSSIEFMKQLSLNSLNIYRLAIPVFVGTVIMMFPPSYFASIPDIVRPFLSNGLLVGIILALILENTIRWEKFTSK